MELLGVGAQRQEEGSKGGEVRYSTGRVDARRLKALHSLRVPDDGDTYERFEI